MTNKRRHSPKKRAGSSITRRWVINNLGIIALVLTVLDFAFIYIMQNYYYSASQQYLNTKISSVTGVLSRYAQDADINFSSEMRSTIENFSDKDKMELMAINSRGRVALTSSGFTPAEGAAMPDYEAVMDGGDGYWVGKQGGETIMAVSVDISDMNTEYNAIRVVASLEQIQSTVNSYVWGVSALCAGVLLLLVVTGLYFIRSIVRPIKQINATTKKYAKGDFSVRIQENSSDEIGDLCVSINQMADELSNTENMKNEFISSVSHELRTPLTAIKGWAETMCMEADPDTVQRGVHVIVNETERLSEMVEELLDFSRLQNGIKLNCEVLDFVAEATDAALFVEARIRQEGLHLVYDEPPEPYPVWADPARLRQVFVNVFDNAIKYSPPVGTIFFTLTRTATTVTASIRDQGRGIAPDDLQNVKMKFFKAKNAVRGSGIGLAVVDEITKALGGTADITSTLGQGTTVTITLPIYHAGQEHLHEPI